MAAFASRMGTGATMIVGLLGLLVLLQLQTSPVGAVDILYYNDNGCNGAVAGACYSVEPQTCCATNGEAAVQIRGLLNGESANVYTGGGCKTQIAHLDGPNAGECYYNEAFSGAFWYYDN